MFHIKQSLKYLNMINSTQGEQEEEEEQLRCMLEVSNGYDLYQSSSSSNDALLGIIE